MKKFFLHTLVVLIFLSSENIAAQGCATLNFQLKSEISSTCQQMTMTMMHDALDRPYLYVANKEAGLKIYNISSLSSPVLAGTVPVSAMGGLDVMNLSQSGNYVYLALGNHFNNNQASGMAIVDVSNPSSPVMKSFWTMPASTGGSGIVETEGNYAYLGAMGNGMVILDISNKSSISFVSKIVPEINYPTPNPNATLYNARGMVVKNDIVYLCYDAGGIRIINCINKSAPKETGRYSNPALNGHARAYNNLVLDDTLLYVAVDYCGLEVLNIKDTSNITLAGKWNPYNCPAQNWFSSPGHANEIRYNKNCRLLFISTGKSDLHIVNIADPKNPDSCNIYGGVSNNIGTWGVNIYKDEVYLSYICAVVPFSSNWTGVKILSYTPCSSGIKDEAHTIFDIFPNPSHGNFRVTLPEGSEKLELISSSGQIVESRNTGSATFVDIEQKTPGIYFLRIYEEGDLHIRKVILLP
jgi:hypothetical protein